VTVDLQQRLLARDVTIASPAMYQRWTDLLFLHWRVDASDLQRRLPVGLTVDTHEGEAWLGIVPFFMERIRPRFLPAIPWLSWFHELNVRTYVHDAHGTPGVWFFSLDCDQPVAVRAARTLFNLPYFNAKMHSKRSPEEVQYTCQRRGQSHASRIDYALETASHHALPGSLEFFLAERYVLFANTANGLKLGRVAHTPYPLCEARVTQSDALPLVWNGLSQVTRRPDHILGSRGVDVRVGALEPIAR
jgi:uncharacterized protein